MEIHSYVELDSKEVLDACIRWIGEFLDKCDTREYKNDTQLRIAENNAKIIYSLRDTAYIAKRRNKDILVSSAALKIINIYTNGTFSDE